jgi:hypothetical protein
MEGLESEMSDTHEFDAIIEDAGGGGAFVTVPFDVEVAFGNKRPKIKATIDGVPYRGSLVRMGTPRHLLPVLKQIRDRIGKQTGDSVHIVIDEDAAPRIVQVPDDLRLTLEDEPDANAWFEKLSHTHRNEYVTWIEEAKRPETRPARVEKAVGMLRQGNRAP